jgi:hypothetical protein
MPSRFATMPTIHPADLDVAVRLAEAETFTATIFIGRGEFVTRECATLAEAREAAQELTARYRHTHRRAMVYAVGRGRQTFIPEVSK